MLAGELYSPLDRVLVEERKKAKSLQQRYNFGEEAGSRSLLVELLPNGSSDILIEPPFFCDYGYNIHSGKRVYFNVNCVVLDAAKISIGSRVLVGPGVHIYASTHPVELNERKSKALAKTISIGDDCWIGGWAIICPGVKIGDNCIVAAGAVVTRDVPSDSMVAGNPARLIKKLK